MTQLYSGSMSGRRLYPCTTYIGLICCLLSFASNGLAQSPATRPTEIAELVKQSRKLTDEQSYQQSLAVIDQILKLDPKNDYALGARPLVEDRMLIEQQRARLMPFPQRPKLATTEEIVSALGKKLPEIKFDGVPLGDVVDFFEDVSGIRVTPDWNTLAADGITPQSPISQRLRDVRFSDGITAMLRNAGGEKAKTDYAAVKGEIVISSQNAIAGMLETTVYDVKDLIEPNRVGINSSREANVDVLVRDIEAIHPETWKDSGGRYGTVTEAGGKLTITNKPEVHVALKTFLDKRRPAKP